jgi:hypothetical protein
VGRSLSGGENSRKMQSRARSEIYLENGCDSEALGCQIIPLEEALE